MSRLVVKFNDKTIELTAEGKKNQVKADEELTRLFNSAQEVFIFDPFQLRRRKVKPQKSLLDAFIWFNWLKEHNPEQDIKITQIPDEVKKLLVTPDEDSLF